MLRKGLDKLYTLSGWLGAACIAAICLLVVCQVALNAIDRISTLLTGTAVGLTIPSYADFTGFFLAASSFLALAYTLRHGAHIRVTLVYGHVPAGVQKLLEIWACFFGAAVSVYFSWFTGQLTWESYVYHDLSPGMIAVPLWIPQLAMLLGLIILSIALFDSFICLLIQKNNQPSEGKKHV